MANIFSKRYVEVLTLAPVNMDGLGIGCLLDVVRLNEGLLD